MQLKSFNIYRSNHNYQRMIYGSLPISWSLKALGRIKESIGYLNYAKRLSRQYENGESQPLLDCQLADRYYELKEYRLADTYISSALRKLPDAEKSSAYTIAANISAALEIQKKQNRIATDFWTSAQSTASKLHTDSWRNTIKVRGIWKKPMDIVWHTVPLRTR